MSSIKGNSVLGTDLVLLKTSMDGKISEEGDVEKLVSQERYCFHCSFHRNRMKSSI